MEISTRTPVRARPTECAFGTSTISAGLLLATLAGNAKAVDVDAGEYAAALPAGSNIGLLYLQHAERRSLYGNGHKVAIKAGLDSDIGILRVANYQQFGDYTINTQFLLPFGRMEGTRDNDSLGQTNGVGDLVLASTLWLVNDPAKNRYWGIAPYLFVPTGNPWNAVLDAAIHRARPVMLTALATDPVNAQCVLGPHGHRDHGRSYCGNTADDFLRPGVVRCMVQGGSPDSR
jgi:hypothetical protein